MAPDTISSDVPWSGAQLSLSARDTMLWERSAQQIRAQRCGSLLIRLVDQENQPLRGVNVHYAQQSHALTLGVHYPYRASAYDLLQEGGVNAATLWLGWRDVQPAPGRWNWEYLQRVWNPAALARRGLRLHAQALLWFKPEWRVAPDYLLRAPTTDRPRLVYEHVHELVHRWGAYLGTYELVNEPFWKDADLSSLSVPEMVSVVHAAALAVRDMAPSARLEVNFAEVSRIPSYRVRPMDFLEALERAGVPYHRIGLQALENGYSGNSAPTFYRTKSFTGILQVLHQYAQIGKPLHISALAVPSAPPAVRPPSDFKPPYGEWDENTQARYLDAAYTLLFAQPSVEGITWWCPVDGRLSWIRGGGLLREDLSLKPSYRALRSWVERHTTAGQTVTDGDGKAVISGYAGDYDVAIDLGRRVERRSLTIVSRVVREHVERIVWLP